MSCDRQRLPNRPAPCLGCAHEAALLSTFLVEESKKECLRDVLIPDGLPSFEGGGNAFNLGENVSAGPVAGVIVVGKLALLVHLDESVSHTMEIALDCFVLTGPARFLFLFEFLVQFIAFVGANRSHVRMLEHSGELNAVFGSSPVENCL